MTKFIVASKRFANLEDWQAYLVYTFVVVAVALVGVTFKNWWYPSEYVAVAPELVELSARANFLTTTNLLDKPAAKAIERLIQDAEVDGICLVVTDGYRTHEEQQKLVDIAKENGTEAYVAPVGQSEHHTGLAVDVGGCPMTAGVRDDNAERLELRNDFDTLPEYQWLLENAAAYGYFQSYTIENQSLTGVPAEPWHWFYKGI